MTAQTVTEVTTGRPLVFVVAPPKSDWQTGFDLYIAGKSESACKNTAQIAGWWAALDAEAACNVCDRMASDGKMVGVVDYTRDGLTDREWRYGA